MRKIICVAALIIVALFTLSFFSCQPEIQSDITQTRIDSAGSGLLTKIDGKSGNDTVSVTFRYDAQKRWIGSQIFSLLNGNTTKVTIAATRDASGFLTSCISVDSSFYSLYGADTTIYTIFHNATNGQYLRTTAVDPRHLYRRDTFDFVYDNSGKIIKQYSSVIYSSTVKDSIVFRYDGSNIDSITEKLAYGGIYPNSGAKLGTRHDNQTAPLVFSNEGIVIQMPYLYGVGNITMFTHTDTGYLLGQGIITYTYSSTGKPVRANITILPSNRQCTLNYHYQ